MKYENVVKKVGLVFVSILLSLLGVEIALRLLYPPTQLKYFVWQPNLHFTFHPDSTILNGIHGAKNFDINSDGFRGEKFSGQRTKYLCIGGSTTESLDVDDTECWTYLLQQILNSKYKYPKFQIGSIGKSGCTTRDHFIQVKYFVPQLGKIDGVILMVGFNDMSKRLSRDSLFETNFRFTPDIEDSLKNTIFLRSEIEKVWWRKTELFRLLQKIYHNLKPVEFEWEIKDDKGEIIRTWRTNRASSPHIINTLPDLTAALDEFERNLHMIYSETQKQGIQLILINQATIFKDSMTAYESSLLWTGGIGNFQKEKNHPYYSAKTLKTAMKLYNERMEEWCKRNKQVKFIDLDSKLPKDTSIFYDDCHFTENGERKVAEIISSLLNRSSLLPKEPKPIGQE